ncbi:transposase [Lacrimispora indolis]|uniref:transposase n=1 Tax=Lacrimispora indolis TaxID=69825 RepID=UPI000423A4F6
MPGIGTSIASKLIAEIGDIRRFANADKLARFAGVAPVKFSSAGKGKKQSQLLAQKWKSRFWMGSVSFLTRMK